MEDPTTVKNPTKVKISKDIFKPVSICEWYSHNGRRCRRTGIDNKFCNLHNTLIEDYKILDEKTSCSTKKEIRIIPRSRVHVIEVMKQLGYEPTDLVDIYFPGGSIEEGSISDKNHVEIFTDDSKYYYENVKGKLKAKHIKIQLVKFCHEPGKISVNDEDIYCEECYIKKSKKLGYPCLNLIENRNL